MDLKSLKELPPWEWPEDADEAFLKALQDGTTAEEDRVLAASLAGDYTVINDDLAGALISVLQDANGSEELRSTTAIALGPVLDEASVDEFDGLSDLPISEDTFHRIQEALQKVYANPEEPKDVRRKVLEASVRAPQDWHQEAIRSSYSSDDPDWKATAVFSMRWISGFDEQIVEALASEDSETRHQAVCAAGNWGIDAAWPTVSDLATARGTEKALCLAAIDAVASIRPGKAAEVLSDLTDAEDEDIAAAAEEAIALAEAESGGDLDEEDFEVLGENI